MDTTRKTAVREHYKDQFRLWDRTLVATRSIDGPNMVSLVDLQICMRRFPEMFGPSQEAAVFAIETIEKVMVDS